MRPIAMDDYYLTEQDEHTVSLHVAAPSASGASVTRAPAVAGMVAKGHGGMRRRLRAIRLAALQALTP